MQHLPADLQAAVERTARPGADVSACADRGDNRPTACEVERLRGRRRALAHDQEPVFEASMDDLDQIVLDAVVERSRGIAPRIFGKADRMEVLVKLGAVAEDPEESGRYVPTLAGLLAAGFFPQEFFPRLNVTFTAYPGVTKAHLDGVRHSGTQTVNGAIPEMLERSLELLREHDIPEHLIPACREAIVNALQHRDYSPGARGAQVQINLFADRLEILNPGGLYGAASLSSLQHGISAARNVRLSQLLGSTPCGRPGEAPGCVVENLGTGLPRIRVVLQEASMPEPELRDFGTAFRITFFKRSPAGEERGGKPWADFKAALISELEKSGGMSVAEIMARSGLSRNTVFSKLRDLRKRGLIETTERPKSPKQRYRLVGGRAPK